jgi:hypothetical protein
MSPGGRRRIPSRKSRGCSRTRTGRGLTITCIPHPPPAGQRVGLGQDLPQRAALPDRLDAEPDQVARTSQLHDREQQRRALHQRAEAKRHAGGDDVHAGGVAHDRRQGGAAAMRQRAPDHEQDAGTGNHDQDERRDRERQNLANSHHADHGNHPGRQPHLRFGRSWVLRR